MELIRPFERLGKDDAGLAGGKGASLGEMTQAGIPVPPGFVILADAFERFLKEADLNQELDAILHTVKHEEIHTVESASERIKAVILAAKMPGDIADLIQSEFKKLDAEFVAVRSSATAEDGVAAAWAGQLDTFLNTTEEKLLENVQRCWASLFTPRAIFYRFEKGMHGTKISVAVVVQKMIQSEVSGIAFSVHPVTEDYNQLIIEAGFGLGEAIVSGQVTPDSYVVEKNPRSIIDKNISFQSRALWRGADGGNEWRELSVEEGNKPSLRDEQVLELAELVLHIEKHYGFPCDIEWAFEAGKFFITQSRPITTLSVKQPAHERSEENMYNNIVQELSGFVNNLPDLSQYDYWGQYKTSIFNSWFWVLWYDKILAEESHFDLLPGGSLYLKGGHFMTDKKVMERSKEIFLNLIKSNPEKIVEFARIAGNIFENFSKIGPEKSDEDFVRKVMSQGHTMLFYWYVGWEWSVILDKLLEKEMPGDFVITEYISIETPLVEQQRELRDLNNEFEKKSIDLTHAENALRAITQDTELDRKFQVHLKKYRWVNYLMFFGENLISQALMQQLQHVHKDKKSTKMLPANHPFKKYKEIAEAVGYLNQAGAEYFSIFGANSRPYLEQIASKMKLSHQELLDLSPEELIDGETVTQLREKISRRKDGNCFIYEDRGKAIFEDNKQVVDSLADRFIPKADKNVTELQGQTGNAGYAKGIARVIISAEDFSKMQKGEVLVTTMTTPDFILLMQKSSAIVTDMGGMLSHAAIISRELGKPCIIGTRFATQVFKDGDMVEVDADNGIVRIIKKNESLTAEVEERKMRAEVARTYVPLMSDLFIRSYAHRENYRTMFLVDGYVRIGYLGGKYYYGPEAADFAEHIYAAEQAKPGFILKAFANIYKRGEKLLTRSQEIQGKDYTRMPLVKLQETFRELSEEYSAFALSLLGFQIQFPIEREVRKLLVARTDASEALSILTFPRKMNFAALEQENLLRIAAEIKKKGDIPALFEELPRKAQNLIQEHVKEYGWINTRGGLGKSWTTSEILGRIQEVGPDYDQKLKNILNHAEEMNEKFHELIASLKLDTRQQQLIETAKELVYYRTYRTDYLNRIFFNVRNLLDAVAEKRELSLEEVVHLQIDEIVQNVSVSNKEIKRRMSDYALFSVEPEKTIFTSDEKEMQAIFDTYCEAESIRDKEIKGSAAYGGKVKGIARIVISKKDMHKVNKGDIMISPMTTPDMIPAMSLAAGFVTDEGGITCHAAIVSREMKKPCVIGTRTATQVLKDGDLVEVDADRGIVRILEKQVGNTQIPNFPKDTYRFIWGNYQTMQTIENNLMRFIKYPENPWNFLGNMIQTCRANRIQTYDSVDALEMGVQVGKMFLDSTEYKDFVTGMEKEVHETWKFYERCRKTSYGHISDKELLTCFNEAQEHWQKIIGYFGATQPEGIQMLIDAIKPHVTPDELAVLLLSAALDEANKEAIDWWAMVQKPFSTEALLEHAYKYPWIASVHFTYEDVYETLTQRYESDKAHAHEPRILGEKQSLHSKHDAILKEKPNLRELVERIQRLSCSRMELKAAWAGVDFYMIPVISEIAKRTGESVQDINLFYRIEEVSQLVRNKERISQDIKDARKRCFVGAIQGGKLYYFEGEAAERATYAILGDDYEKKEKEGVIKGTVAHPGVVKGTVRILHANDVRRSRELRSSFKKGEIFVTEMTQPNIIDIASKAGAIVTDEGSLLSHAAIISREFKIPCIVGTGNATKALQDGDLVEVDANQGVVKVLNVVHIL